AQGGDGRRRGAATARARDADDGARRTGERIDGTARLRDCAQRSARPGHGMHAQRAVRGGPRRNGARARQRLGLPRPGRPLRRGLAVAAAGARRAARTGGGAGRGSRLLPRQAAGLRLVLSLGVAEDPPLVRTGEQPRPHLPRNAGRLVLEKTRKLLTTKDTKEHEGEARPKTRANHKGHKDHQETRQLRISWCPWWSWCLMLKLSFLRVLRGESIFL